MTVFEKDYQIDFRGKVLEVTLKYSKGGINYFNYRNEQRGYYVHFLVVEKTRSNGVVSRRSSPMSDRECGIRQGKIFCFGVGRRSKKKEEKFINSVDWAHVVREWGHDETEHVLNYLQNKGAEL